ncbi:MAG: acyl carrier protein [Hyphomicrobiales bacterium]|nr:MAG: acyl carrier protein [Hyphomicrobiales bacterium]
MTDGEALYNITSIVRDQLDDEAIVLDMDTVATSVEGWDSLSHVRIMIAVEEEFGVKFRTSEIAGLKNVGDLVRLVKNRD